MKFHLTAGESFMTYLDGPRPNFNTNTYDYDNYDQYGFADGKIEDIINTSTYLAGNWGEGYYYLVKE
jgi:hypothetical protein